MNFYSPEIRSTTFFSIELDYVAKYKRHIAEVMRRYSQNKQKSTEITDYIDINITFDTKNSDESNSDCEADSSIASSELESSSDEEEKMNKRKDEIQNKLRKKIDMMNARTIEEKV